MRGVLKIYKDYSRKADVNLSCFEKIYTLRLNRKNFSLNHTLGLILIIIALDENLNLNKLFILYTKMRKVRKLSGMMMILIETMHKQLFLLEAINLRCKC